MSIHKHRYDEGDTAAWLALRSSMKDKIGGSEIGVVAGHSPYNSPFSMFCQKTGATKTPILKKREAIIQGHDGEDVVAVRFEREMGKRVHRENCIITNDAYPHLKASVDRLIYGEKSGLECKTAKDMAMKKYKHGDFPMSYFDQCLLYLAVTEYDRWYLAIQVFGTAYRMFMMTTVKDEADRYEELKKKFSDWEDFKSRNYLAWTWVDESKSFKFEGEGEHDALDIPESISAFMSDADLTEWETKWCKLEAVYYVDRDEFNAAEELAATFCNRVGEVERMMSEWKPDANMPDDEVVVSAARRSALIVAVNTVWPKTEIDGSDATTEAVCEITPNAVVDSVVTLDETDDVFAMTVKRAEIDAKIKELETSKREIENKVAMSVGLAETVKMPGWKITYKMGTQRETASAQKVKEYFANHGEQVPNGIISVSEAKRSLRFWTQGEKSRGMKKSA